MLQQDDSDSAAGVDKTQTAKSHFCLISWDELCKLCTSRNFVMLIVVSYSGLAKVRNSCDKGLQLTREEITNTS